MEQEVRIAVSLTTEQKDQSNNGRPEAWSERRGRLRYLETDTPERAVARSLVLATLAKIAAACAAARMRCRMCTEARNFESEGRGV